MVASTFFIYTIQCLLPRSIHDYINYVTNSLHRLPHLPLLLLLALRNSRDMARLLHLCVLAFFFFCSAEADDAGWESAHATSTSNAQEMSPCGYLHKEGYNDGVSISVAMYQNGHGCGACYEIKCIDHPKCITNSSIHVTATAQCSASYLNGSRRWCEEPNSHFELATSFFKLISADENAVVPVAYKHVSCVRKGGIKFDMIGKDAFFGVLVYNVAGPGAVGMVKVKGSSRSDWVALRNLSGDERWYAYNEWMLGQSLSFQVVASDGRMVQFDDLAPKDWKFGQTFEGGQF